MPNHFSPAFFILGIPPFTQPPSCPVRSSSSFASHPFGNGPLDVPQAVLPATVSSGRLLRQSGYPLPNTIPPFFPHYRTGFRSISCYVPSHPKGENPFLFFFFTCAPLAASIFILPCPTHYSFRFSFELIQFSTTRQDSSFLLKFRVLHSTSAKGRPCLPLPNLSPFLPCNWL